MDAGALKSVQAGTQPAAGPLGSKRAIGTIAGFSRSRMAVADTPHLAATTAPVFPRLGPFPLGRSQIKKRVIATHYAAFEMKRLVTLSVAVDLTSRSRNKRASLLFVFRFSVFTYSMRILWDGSRTCSSSGEHEN
jgi:hypothetical protein